MFSNIRIEKIKEDGTKLDIRVLLIDGEFRVDDVGIKKRRQRNFRYLSHSITGSYSYRKLNTEDRREFMLREFIKECTVELINEALEEAWLSLKPKRLET